MVFPEKDLPSWRIFHEFIDLQEDNGKKDVPVRYKYN